MKTYTNIFNTIISPENLFAAWREFRKDKKHKRDVQAFEFRLEEYLFQLHRDLKNKTYQHGSYTDFYINDPKRRHIHKALVRDRVLHHALFSVLNPIFEPTFIHNSFSCRKGKGTHKGVSELERAACKISRNYRKPCYVLKCDIRKFFDSVDHETLKRIITRHVCDQETLDLCYKIIDSFSVPQRERESKKGLPIGNLTSQLFANIYMNEFDQFIKHILRAKHYIRYTDDFVIVYNDALYLHNLLPNIHSFLQEQLRLQLHPQKITIRKLHNGIDFLGYIILSHYRVLRTRTKQRMMKNLERRFTQCKRGEITRRSFNQTLQSYFGVLSHANTHRVSEELKNKFS